MNIQKTMQELFGNSCYAYCISYISGKRDIKDLTTDVLEGWKKGFIDDDGFVSQPHKFYNYCFGKELARDVRKPDYKPDQDIFIVEWKNPKGGSHFTVETSDTLLTDKALFDPSGSSISRAYNKVISYREFIK